jgi:hypothetical protein
MEIISSVSSMKRRGSRAFPYMERGKFQLPPLRYI